MQSIFCNNINIEIINITFCHLLVTKSKLRLFQKICFICFKPEAELKYAEHLWEQKFFSL